MSRTTHRHRGSARLSWLSSIGCALLALLCVAAGPAVAAATKSSPDAIALSEARLGDSLVLPSVDRLVGGEQAQLALAARRSDPAAIAQRVASHTAFEGLSSRMAISAAKRAFPALVDGTAGGVPQLSPGERIVRYPTSNAAQVTLPGRVGVIETLEPIASGGTRGAHLPFDLTLARAGDGYAPVRSPVELSVPSALSRGVELPQLGVSLTPVDRRGLALAASAGQPDGAGVLWNAAAGTPAHDLATLAKASPRGFDLSTLLFSQRSPNRLYFRVGMPNGARLQRQHDGAVWIVKGRQTIAVVSPVSAEDAEGSSVPTSVSVSGTVISVHVDTSGDRLYPIAVDPEVNDSQLAKTSAGKRSNWEFHTESAHFSKSESNGGPGAESLETKASGGYGPSEWGFWGYQTKGVSHIYGITTVTSAHNSGAKVESFLEFEEPPPAGTLFGIQESKKILSIPPSENPEYERKPVGLCPVPGAEVCLPSMGKPNNAVHFQQSTTGSSGTGFSDSMAQGIVSIAEPTGTHSATSYNVSSPTVEVEVEKEGKKEKVKRTNALLNGAHTWLSKLAGASGGAIELKANDPGIGVSATELEYESSSSVWTPLEQHNYLAENGCQGVQCYVTHGETWILSPTVPDGEPKLRYKAEEAISGTQSLPSEGQATVKVDTKKPHNLEIDGLPYGNELSERPYQLTVKASDGEGSTVPSSGIKSISLFVDGHEVGVPEASCTVAKGQCTASISRTVNGAELGAGKHSIEILTLDNAGNEARHSDPIAVRHSTPVALGPGSVDLESGDFALGATDVSLGSGLTMTRNYSSRAVTAGDNGPLGPGWNLSLGNAESLEELITGDVLMTAANGKQTIFATLGAGKFESPTGDSNLELTLEENKTTKKKLAYYLKDPAAHTSVKFTQPAGAGKWVPVTQEGSVAPDTVTYSYETVPAVSQYPVPGGSNTAPTGIAAGPDGNMWFTERLANKVGKITPTGSVASYQLPAESEPEQITSGSDGNVWFTENAHRVGKIAPSGTLTEYATSGARESTGIVTGQNGWVWYSEWFNHTVVSIDTSGNHEATDTFPVNSGPTELAAGPDGNIWVVLSLSHKIGRVNGTGGSAVTEFTLPAGSVPVDIVAGPEKSMWFTNSGTKKIGKITMAGVVTEYPLPEEGGTPSSIAEGPEGDLWFTTGGEQVGRITASGEVSEYHEHPKAIEIAPSPDGNMWFSSGWAYTTNTDDIGSISPPGSYARPAEVRAPVPAGVACSWTNKPTEMNPGCRALELGYSEITTAKGEAKSEWGTFAGRLERVWLVAYNPASKSMEEPEVARYQYDSLGRLRAAYDPRIAPALKTTYGYDENGHLTVLNPPGQEPWTFTYGTSAGDNGTGRLLKAARAPAAAELWKGEAVANTETPKITGAATEGVRLSASSGKWSGSPNSYSFEWQRCSAGTCHAILGATSANYTPQAADVGDTLLVTVRATNGDGSVAASAETAIVKTLAGNVSEYALPASSGPKGITAGPEAGTLWFVDFTSSRVGKSTSSGTITEYALPASSGPEAIAKGSDGNLWVANYTSSKIAKVTSTGTVAAEYALPLNSHPKDIVAGPDGNLWFAEYSKSKIAKITTSGAITEYALPTNAHPTSLAVGPDGNLWFTEYERNEVGKITTSGAITEYVTPGSPMDISTGPDGNLWFVEHTAGYVAKITTSGAVTEYALPFAEAEYIASAAGSLWVTGKESKKLYRVSTAGAVTESALPEASQPQEMTVNSLGDIWYVEFNDKLAKFSPSVLSKGELKSPEPGTTLNYNVPLSGAGAPGNMSASEVAKWGQSDDPVEATAITAPDEPQSWPASSYKRATVHYFDEHGRQVNLAAPSTSTYGAVATTEYNEYNDPIRTLSADNRATALEAGSASVEKSKLLDTQNTYNGEGAKEGEVQEPGTRLIDSVGPQHKVTYLAGHEQKESLARLHSKLFYDEGAPGGETYDLLTKKTTLAQLSNEEEVEVRTTKTSYAGPAGHSNLGWELRAPTSVTTIDPEGNPLTKSATEYDPTTGQVTESRGTAAETTLSYAKKFGEQGSEAGKLKTPWGAAVNAEGALLVVDSANNRIEKFSAEGVYVSSFGELGSGNGQLKEPQGIALDSSGSVYVADAGNNRIEVFSSTGTFVKSIGSLGTESGKLKAPSDIAFDPKGNLWVADTGNSRVEKFTKEGVYGSEFGSAGTEPGKLSEPKGIAVDAGEHVWVADTNNNRIQEFSGTGSLLKRFGASGAGEGQLNTPIDLKIDAQGNIWTADSKNNRAEAFSPAGAYVTQIGYKGTAAGQLSEPKGLAFDATGKAWVTDSADNRLEQWSKGPNAHDQKTIYYSTAANGEYPACGAHAEWAGLVCETLPAKQPELMGLPPLPTITYASYNIYDEPETVTETFGSSTRTKKESYDAAGRRATSETTASSGKSLPQVTFSYNSEQGVLEKESAEGKALASEFNRLGQLTKYSDADGNSAKYTYQGPENDYLLSEASDSSASGTSKQSYEYDPTTKLRTKLIDSAAGSFTAAYDTEGKLTSESYPYGLCANYSYNSIGEASSLQYIKSSKCSEIEAGTYYQDSRSSSIRGEMLSQSSTLANEIYTYDPSGRLTETQETPAGEGCTVRAYAYDEEANRASSTTRPPGTGGACQAEGGTIEAHNYDEGNRLADGSMAYDAYGNVTKLPAADAEGHELSSTYYVDNAVATQTQNGITNEYKVDPEGRTRELISGSTKTIEHYDGAGEAIAWSETPEKWVRNIAGIDGSLLATQTNGETPVLQLHDLQGNVIATIGDKAGETKLLSSYNSTEFGVPKGGKAPPKFAYLGALGVESSFSSGVITYGATSYVPQTGRALQSEAVEAPGAGGGSGAGAPYTMQEEPWNMQGAAREASEAPGLEAARERAAFEAAMAAVEEAGAPASPMEEAESEGEWEEEPMATASSAGATPESVAHKIIKGIESHSECDEFEVAGIVGGFIIGGPEGAVLGATAATGACGIVAVNELNEYADNYTYLNRDSIYIDTRYGRRKLHVPANPRAAAWYWGPYLPHAKHHHYRIFFV